MAPKSNGERKGSSLEKRVVVGELEGGGGGGSKGAESIFEGEVGSFVCLEIEGSSEKCVTVDLVEQEEDGLNNENLHANEEIEISTSKDGLNSRCDDEDKESRWHGGLPLKCFWHKTEEPMEKSESEKELDVLWEEMDSQLRQGRNN
ncbi:hypothetical protein RIF29_17621 [Crotalaria pallida]|uniref:Uncharacterized protein n=1 Tax=Crotalaria pallida TaxID=3830 RepID=A0AAN9FKU3_CROPI